MNVQNVLSSLELMVKGMAAIFFVIIVIYAAVNLMIKFSAKSK